MANVKPLVAVFSAVDKFSQPMKQMQEALANAQKQLNKTDTKQFNTAIKTAQRHFNEFKSNVSTGMKAVGTALAVGMAGMVYSSYGAINAFDEMGSSIDDVSNRLGVSSQALQEWRYSALRTGSSPEAMDKALQMLNKTMQSVVNGSGAEAQELFKRLGINIKDSNGNLRSATDVMLDLSKAFKVNENGALRTSMAMTLLGKSGTELIPLLANGTEEFMKYQQEMADYGLLLSQEEIDRAALTGDYFDRMRASASILQAKIGGALAPAFMTLSDSLARAFGQLSNNKELLNKISEGIGSFANSLASIDWASVISSFMKFTSSIFKAVDAVGGFKNIAIAIAGFLGFTKVLLPLIQTVMALKSALVLLGGGFNIVKLALMGLMGSTGIGAIVILLGALAVWIYTHWDTVTKWFDNIVTAAASVYKVIKSSLIGVWDNVTNAITNSLNSVKSFAKSIFDTLKSWFDSYINGVKQSFETLLSWFTKIKDTISNAWDTFKAWVNPFDNTPKHDINVEQLHSTTLNANNMLSSAINGNMTGVLDVNIKTQKGTIADVTKQESSSNLTINSNQGILR